VCPLFASLPQEQQLKAFGRAPINTRKVILATNIAETSVTVPGVRYVVDTGFVKVRRFAAATGLDILRAMPGRWLVSAGPTNARADGRGLPGSGQGPGSPARGSCGSRGAGQVLPPLHGARIRGGKPVSRNPPRVTRGNSLHPCYTDVRASKKQPSRRS
jgi:hypothetical protein